MFTGSRADILEGSILSECHAARNGGGAHVQFSDCRMVQSSIVNCSAGDRTGGLDVGGDRATLLATSSVRAPRLEFAHTTPLHMLRCPASCLPSVACVLASRRGAQIIEGCSAENVGAIQTSSGAEAKLVDCRILRCHCALGSGGGLVAAEASAIEMTRGTIAECSAGWGGAAYLDPSGRLALVDVLVAQCRATSSTDGGGGVHPGVALLHPAEQVQRPLAVAALLASAGGHDVSQSRRQNDRRHSAARRT